MRTITIYEDNAGGLHLVERHGRDLIRVLSGLERHAESGDGLTDIIHAQRHGTAEWSGFDVADCPFDAEKELRAGATEIATAHDHAVELRPRDMGAAGLIYFGIEGDR